MEYLIAVDLEGIHGVKGEAYKTLSETADYQAAIEGGVLEINAAVKALFDNGATKVAVWDNHAGGGNLDFTKIDSRVVKVDGRQDEYRLDFTREHDFKAVLFLGYHAKEGAPMGVLAHSYNSKQIQYMKLNGKAVGELTVDCYICEERGIQPIFASSDDIALREIKGLYPSLQTVITKYGKGRNDADFKPREQVLKEIYDGVAMAVKDVRLRHGTPVFQKSTLEIRYTRAEKAEEMSQKAKQKEIIAEMGEDTHVQRFQIDKATQITLFV